VSLAVVLGIGLLGGAGATLRFLLDAAIARRLGRAFPFGTLGVNVSGSLALGVAAGAALGDDGSRLIATGLIGAFTTFSTWAFESHRLAEDGEGRLGTLNFAVSLVAGIVAVWAGRRIGAML
jgi:fluoride exporter